MSKIEWERDLVESPFCRQLQAMGWEWIQGDPDLPESTERGNSREVLLRGRLAAALRRINLRDGAPWLDEGRINQAIRDLEQAPGHGPMEANQAATELLLKGTVVEGLPDWDQGRPQPVRYIDFDHTEDHRKNNDFLVINQLLIASDFFEARAATLGAPPEAYLEWSDTSPVPATVVAEELGLIADAPDAQPAAAELALLGPEQSERAGTPLFFRTAAKRPPAMRAPGLQSQQLLVAGMLRPAHLLDLVRNFTVFRQVDGRTRKIVARYPNRP